MFFLSANHFQPANPESLTTPDSPIRSLVVIVLKLKSQLSFFENLRGIVRAKKLSEVKSLQNPKSLSMSNNGQFVKDFSANKSLSFSFSLWPLTTEAMGIWRFAGAFTVAQRQGECGSKTAGMHVSQPMTHRRVLCASSLVVYSCLCYVLCPNGVLTNLIFSKWI